MPVKAELDYYKHLLMGKTKKFFKEIFAKGPENLVVRITEDIIIMEMLGIFRKVELELISCQSEMCNIVLSYRNALFEFMKEHFIEEVEKILDRQVIHVVFNITADNSALCVIILNKPI